MPTPNADALFAYHPRDFAENLYVYPVLSRRAGGISIGVNLSRDKRCNFDCVYCQVVRRMSDDPVVRQVPDDPVVRQTSDDSVAVDLARLRDELDATLELVRSGRIYELAGFRGVPQSMRRLSDIALSGDGEPTLAADFGAAVELLCDARRRHGLTEVKLVLITNATLLGQPRVAGALKLLEANNGEIWAKLDAGTEGYYRRISRSSVPWPQILDNLRQAARKWPIVIQSLFLRLGGEVPTAGEIEAYCERLTEITSGGGQIKLVQIHTIARDPAEKSASALENEQLDAIAHQVRTLTGLTVAVYYGSGK